jgi:tripartite ATP-independent transporter DctM subunit
MIPPSNVMIVYSVAAGSVSIAAMFMAGVLPGVLTGLCIMLAAGIVSIFNGYRGEVIELPRWKPILATSVIAIAILALVFVKAQPIGVASVFSLLCLVCLFCFRSFRRSFLTLLLIGIVIGGILGGIFTATEAAAISVVYAFFLSVVLYREIPLRQIPDILRETGMTTAVVMLLIAASSGMSWIMTMANIPQTVSSGLLGLSENPIMILLAINVLLICVGTFMDMTPAILIFTPIFLPVVEKLGMHPIHFGIMIIANLSIGLCTPPVGTCLFIGCKVGQTTITNVTKPMLPFFFAMMLALSVITLVPTASLWLPVQTGQLKQAEVDALTFMQRMEPDVPKPDG